MFTILNRLLDNYNNSIEILVTFAQELQVKITKTGIEKKMEGHPDFPSLLAISDVLTELGIENLSLKIAADKLSGIEPPFLAQVTGKKEKKELFTVVRKIEDGNITYFNPDTHKWEQTIFTYFEKNFKGVVLIAEPMPGSGEKEYATNKKEEERKTFRTYISIFCLPVITGILCVLAFAKNGSGAILPVIFTLLTLSGCLLSIVLILYEIDRNNPVIMEICSGNKKVNCSAVLDSSFSKIGGISWSAIGLSYFAGELLALLLTNLGSPQLFSILAWINLLSCPYVLFSVYYQWRIARQWCVLCLGVQCVLILQMITTFLGKWHTQILFNESNLIPIIISVMILSLMVFFLMPVLLKSKESKIYKKQLLQLKHDPNIFYSLLHKENPVSTSTAGLGIILGNPEAKNKIVKVCNPYCGPCAQAHLVIDKLLDNNPDIQLQIIFTASANDYKTSAVQHLLAIASKGNNLETQRSLNGWYGQEIKDYALFSEKFPIEKEFTNQEKMINNMYEWCKQENITYTPTLFINGHHLPKMYNINDLKYFLSV